MASKNIVIFLGSIRPGRMVERVGHFVKRTVEANGMKAVMFDPRVMKFDLVETPLHFMPDQSKAPGWMKQAQEALIAADGFIIVSPEYNCTLPPPLTNMMCHFPPVAYRNRPCGLVSYSIGPFGGIRALTALRAYAAEFGMLPVPTNVPIPGVGNSFKEDGTCTEPLASVNILNMVKEVVWFGEAVKKQKGVRLPPT